MVRIIKAIGLGLFGSFMVVSLLQSASASGFFSVLSWQASHVIEESIIDRIRIFFIIKLGFK
jgi:hypothetical protein